MKSFAKNNLKAIILICFSIICGFGLSACGFKPLYSEQNYHDLIGLRVEAGQNRIDYLVQDAITDFTGSGQSPYILNIKVDVRDQGIGLSASGVATRMTLTGIAHYKLSGKAKPVTGQVKVSVTYDTPTGPYALIAARSSAEERLAKLMAEEIIQSLNADLQTP